MTPRDVMNRLLREGWTKRPGKGSHAVFRKPGHQQTIVPDHPGDIAPGTLRSICKTAGWEYPPARRGE